MSVQEHWIKPRSADINENVLSEQAKEELGMTEDLIRKGQPLDQVIAQVQSTFITFMQQQTVMTNYIFEKKNYTMRSSAII